MKHTVYIQDDLMRHYRRFCPDGPGLSALLQRAIGEELESSSEYQDHRRRVFEHLRAIEELERQAAV